MKEFVITEAKVETAVLVGLITPQQNEKKTEEYLNELEFLAETAGAKVIKRYTQKVNGPSSVTYLGSGKLEEIAQFIKDKQDEVDAYWEEQIALGNPYQASIVTGTKARHGDDYTEHPSALFQEVFRSLSERKQDSRHPIRQGLPTVPYRSQWPGRVHTRNRSMFSSCVLLLMIKSLRAP